MDHGTHVVNLQVLASGNFLSCQRCGAIWNGLMGDKVPGRSTEWGVGQPVGCVPPSKTRSKSPCTLVVKS